MAGRAAPKHAKAPAGPLERAAEAVVPRRLGSSFRWLMASSWVTNTSDGIALAAGPLLVASETDSPELVAASVLLQRLPFVLFGLYAGVLADRLHRRRLLVVVNLLRTLVLAILATVIWSGEVSIAAVLVAMFLLGTAETFADTTTMTLLPMMVHKRDLGIANARLYVGVIVANQLAGPPIGALLFTAGRALPFATQAVLLALGVVLVSRIAVSAPVRTGESSHARRDVAEGIRWLWGHPPIRTLTLTIVFFNITYGAAWSVLVLYTDERLGLGEIGFGLVATMGALGGILGTSAYGWLERRFSLGDIMRVGLIIETLTHLVLAVTTRPAVALATFFVFGAHAFVWGTTANSIRQRAVPMEFQGRVGSVYMMGVVGGLALGAIVGGALAGRWGITAPFWFAFVGSAVLLAALWGQLAHIAHVDAESMEPDDPDDPGIPVGPVAPVAPVAEADPAGTHGVAHHRVHARADGEHPDDVVDLRDGERALADQHPDPTPAGK
jgi:predicted MFS family arabinose efflux permease